MYVYQDNNSSQLLIKNGELSSGIKTKHKQLKIFFIKDKIDNQKIRVIDCPAEEMCADILTKPLQEMAIRKMRKELMNCPVNYEENDKFAEKPARCHNLNPVMMMKTANKQLASASPQACVGHKRIQAAVMDRRVGVNGKVSAER